MKDAISYIRVSSEQQADSELGLEAQRQRIAAYCAMKGLHLAEVFEDPGISAGKPLASPPAGSRLLAAAKKSKAVVVVAKLDRPFRSVADAANVIADFGLMALKGIQQAMADGSWMTDEEKEKAKKKRQPIGWCRNVVNRRLTRIKSFFKCAKSRFQAVLPLLAEVRLPYPIEELSSGIADII